MIIGIDGNEANQKIKAGSGVYAFELLRQFKKFKIQNFPQSGIHDAVVAHKFANSIGTKFKIYLKDDPISELPSSTDYWEYKIIKPAKLWTQLGLPLQLWKEKLTGKIPDVFFSPSHYAPRFCPIPSVITIFDLSFIRFPDFFLKKDLYKLKNWTEYSIAQAKKIITISEFSKKEIVDYYKVAADKITVAYPGYDRNKYQISNIKCQKHISKIKNKYKIEGEYIIFIGTIQPRKNLVRLIEAFAKLEDKNMKLVICGMVNEGRGGWMSDEIIHQAQNSKLKTQNNVIMTGYVDNEDLPQLITWAKVLVLPSLYEGFGIPVIEAMACGVPTVVSNVSSLPEIVGEAAILVDPYDINSILIGLKEACYNETRRANLIRKGYKQIERFNWEKSAKLILDTLLDILRTK